MSKGILADAAWNVKGKPHAAHNNGNVIRVGLRATSEERHAFVGESKVADQ